MRYLLLPAIAAAATTLPAQTGFAELGAADHLPPETRVVLDVKSGELNGDGATDLVVLQRSGVVVLRNRRRDAIFVETYRLPFSAAPVPRAGALGLLDIEGDGDIDVLASTNLGDAYLLRNDGAGGFSVETSPVTGLVRDLAIGDLDGDGDDDVLAGYGLPPLVSGPGAQSRLFRNDAGVLVDATSTQLPTETKNTSAVALFDCDGDGDLDAFCGNAAHYLGPSPQNELWLNNGLGFFSLATSALPPDLDGDEEATVGDLDGDGDLDVVTARVDVVAPSALRLYFNDGTGNFTHGDAAMPAMAGTSATAVALLDRDADGDLDIMLGAGSLTFLRNANGVFQLAGSLAPGDGIARLIAFDADGADGLDLLLGNRGATGSGQRSRLLLDDAAQGLLDACATLDFGAPTGGFSGATMVLADLGNDGDIDMVHTGLDAQPVHVRHSEGDGPLLDVTATHVPVVAGGWLRAMGAIDLDGDGRDDIWGRHQVGDVMTMLIGAADGSLALLPASQTPPIGNGLYKVEAADLDLDGWQDLFVADAFGLHVWRGTAALEWQLDATTSFPPALADFELGDVDADGDLDLAAKAASYRATNTVDVWINDGTGTFTFVQTLSMPQVTVFSGMRFADADGDLDLDLFALADAAAWFANDGTGTFGDARALPMTGQNRRDRLFDADADGDPDICRFGHAYSQTLELWINDGTGVFTDDTAAAFGETTHGDVRSLEIADIDGDGDQDIALDEFGVGVRVLWNQHRHASMPWLTRRGRLARLAWSGTPGEIILPMLALETTQLPLPPFGALRLDLGSLALFPSVTLAANGDYTLDFNVPDDPALNGIELHIQALHFGPPLQAGRHAWSVPIR